MKLNIKPISQKSGGIIKLGFGTETISSAGCLLTGLLMQLGHYNKIFTLVGLNDLLKRIKAFNGSYISWPAFVKHFDLVFEWVKTGDFKKIIKESLDFGDPVIIRISNFEHFVLAIGYDDAGSLFINDPLSGSCYYLKAKGWGIKSLRLLTPLDKPKPPENGSSEALTACLEQHKDLMDQLDKKGKEVVKLSKKLNDSETLQKELVKKIGQLTADNVGLLNNERGWQVKLKTASEQYSLLEENFKKVSAERTQYRTYYDRNNKKNGMELIIEGFKKIFEKKK